MWGVLTSVMTGHPSSGSPVRTIGDLSGIILNIAMGAAFSISVIGVILAGIKYMMSKGDYKAVSDAKQALSYSIVAMILGFGAFSLKLIILNLTGHSPGGGGLGDLRNETPDF